MYMFCNISTQSFYVCIAFLLKKYPEIICQTHQPPDQHIYLRTMETTSKWSQRRRNQKKPLPFVVLVGGIGRGVDVKTSRGELAGMQPLNSWDSMGLQRLQPIPGNSPSDSGYEQSQRDSVFKLIRSWELGEKVPATNGE